MTESIGRHLYSIDEQWPIRYTVRTERKEMKTWTADNRPLVWTVNENNNNTYDLYVHGRIVGEGLRFDDFYPMYKQYVAQLINVAI